ncbi:recombinase family protein [Streptomyces sp. 900105755]
MQTIDVASYVRVSTTEQKGRYGIPAQAQAIHAFVAQQKSWRLVESRADIGESGATHSRPGLNALLQDIRLGRVKHVLVHRIDRLGRTEAAVWRCLWQIEDAGAQVVCCTEPLAEPGLERWLTIDRLARAVETDYRRIAARTQVGRQLKAADGGWPGGPAPYGYRISGRGAFGSTLEVDPAEARVVKLIADLVIDGVNGLTDLADELNNRGALTRNGRRWTPSNLCRRLKSGTFLGEVVFRRVDRQSKGNCTRLHSDGRPQYGESVVIPLPRILSEERIGDLQRVLAGMTRPRRKPNGDYPLSGRIHGPCGLPYIGTFRGRDGMRTYRCSGWGAPTACGCPFLPAEHAEEQVARRVSALLASIPAHRRPMMPSSSEASAQFIRHCERVRSLERLVAECAEELDALRRQARPTRAVAAALRQLETEHEAFDRILGHASDWLSELKGLSDGEVRLTAVLGSADPDLRSLSSSEQRSLIESIKVRVDIADSSFRYREGRKCSTALWHERTGTPVPAGPTDSQWARIEGLLHRRYPAHHFRSPLDLRAALAGMLHRLRTGILWRDLPTRFGDPQKVRWRQRTWLADGVWPEIVKLLDEDGEGVPVASRPVVPEVVVRTVLDAEAVLSVHDGHDVVNAVKIS